MIHREVHFQKGAEIHTQARTQKKKSLNFVSSFVKEPVLLKISQNWPVVNIDGMSKQCTLYSSVVLIFVVFICIMYTLYIKECTFDIFDKPILQV